MPWSAEDAVNAMWSEMDSNVSNGELRAFFKKHLQAAHDASGHAELLAALKGLATRDHTPDRYAGTELRVARAAIAKATP